MKIEINQTVMGGNLFRDSGYDERKSAKKLANILTEKYGEFLQNEYPDSEIIIKIDSNGNSGVGDKINIYVDAENSEIEYTESEKIETELNSICESIDYSDFSVEE